MFDLELNIRSWSDHLRKRGNLKESDIVELENHLRDETDDLIKTGLAPDEAFLISVKRLGDANIISNEYSKINTENMWKYLLMDPVDPAARDKNIKNISLIIVFSLLAGTLIKTVELFVPGPFNSGSSLFYFKNLGLFILPFISAYFLLKRKSNLKTFIIILGLFCLSAIIVNAYPSFNPKDTEFLTGIHLNLLLWLLTGVAYIGKGWQDSKRRMDFIRFTGETVIYGVLIFCGVIVLGMFTQMIFSAIGVDTGWFIQEYLIVYGGCAAALITVYLVESKKSIVENFAPILAKIFSPLFLISMTVFLVVMVVTGKSPFVERNFLIGFDLMLVLVLGLVLYVISSRDIHSNPNVSDYMNLSLICTALIIDVVALVAILFRLSAFGITPNKVAALGENIALFINLGGLAWLYIRYFLKKIDFVKLERWQTFYLNIYAIWMAVVAFLFPVIFQFR